MTVTIKADKALFDRWVELSRRIDALKAFAQNDMEINLETDGAEWRKAADRALLDLVCLIEHTTQWMARAG